MDPLSDILGKMTAQASTSKDKHNESITGEEDVPRSPVKNCSRNHSLPGAQFIPEFDDEPGVTLSIPDEGDEGIFDELHRLIQNNMSSQKSVPEKQNNRTSPPKDIESNVNGKEDKEDEEELEDNDYPDNGAGDASGGESSDEETTPEIGSSDASAALSSSLNNVHDDLDFDEDDDEDEDDDGNFKRKSRQKQTSKAINDKQGNKRNIDTVSAKNTRTTQPKVIPPTEPPQPSPPVNVNVPAGRRLVAMNTEPEEDPEEKKAKRAVRFASAPHTSGSVKITLNNNQNHNINNRNINNNSDNLPLPRPASRPVTSVLLEKSTSSELTCPSREEESRSLPSSLSFSPSHNDVTKTIASEPMSFMHHSLLFDEHKSDLFSSPLKKPDPPAPVPLALNPRDP